MNLSEETRELNSEIKKLIGRQIDKIKNIIVVEGHQCKQLSAFDFTRVTA